MSAWCMLMTYSAPGRQVTRLAVLELKRRFDILRTEIAWEEAGLPVNSSRRCHIDERVNQLRDPAVFEEDGEIYLLYLLMAGESGIAIVRLELQAMECK